MTSQSRQATNRLPVTPELHDELSEFKAGLKLSFNDALAVMLQEVKQGDDAYTAGKKLRQKLARQQK